MSLAEGTGTALTGTDVALTKGEREFLILVQRGDVPGTKRLLDEERPFPFDENCTDALGRSSIGIAVENENIEILEALLERGVEPKDALLSAIAEEYVEGVELLLEWEEANHEPGYPYSWEMVASSTSAFTKDITPLILAAHFNHYEILKLLLDRGATLPMPHDVRCGCMECINSTEDDSLRHSLSRINAYRALSSPSLIALSSKDPVLTAFELSKELARLEGVEHEFRSEYRKLQVSIAEFCSDLLDQVGTHKELSTMLNYSPESRESQTEEEAADCPLMRLKLAIKLNQKPFVAHANVQQLVGAIWFNSLPGFRRLTMIGQVLSMLKLAVMFPVNSMLYIVDPDSENGKFVKRPFVKFISHCSSYMFFLSLLTLASQRVEYILMEVIGSEWTLGILADWKEKERGAFPSLVELMIMGYVFSQIWGEVKSLWHGGLMDYLSNMWNIVDFVTNSFFMMWIQLRMASWYLVNRDIWAGLWPYIPREDWQAFDPYLLAEGFFGAAMVFSFLKLVNIFSVNPHMGPLQISLGRMIFDIVKFFFLYTLVLCAFGCGLLPMLWYYAEIELNNCYHTPDGRPDIINNENSCLTWRRFYNLFESAQSLFWASFSMIEIDIFDMEAVGGFTRFWGLLMFGAYSVINVIVLLNLLIAMMSSSYEIISEKADMEWKFARTKLWMNYFDDGSTVPPPFNMIPSVKSMKKLFGPKVPPIRDSFRDKGRKKEDRNHQDVMRLVIRRYITHQQRKADENKVTDDDVNEIKQDVSTFRYQLIDIFKASGFKTLQTSETDDPTVLGRKGRAMERQLKKGFEISKVKGVLNDVALKMKSKGNIFDKLASVMGNKNRASKRGSQGSAKVKPVQKELIGSTRTSVTRLHSSIKARIQYENSQLLDSMEPSKIEEYNPNLEKLSDQTKIAYAKFKTLRPEKKKQLNEDGTENTAAAAEAHEPTPTPTHSMSSSITYESETKET